MSELELSIIERAGDDLSAACLRVLRKMRDEEEELLLESGVGYVGLTRVGRRVSKGLLMACAISLCQFSDVGGCERYHINGTGRAILERLDSAASPGPRETPG